MKSGLQPGSAKLGKEHLPTDQEQEKSSHFLHIAEGKDHSALS